MKIVIVMLFIVLDIITGVIKALKEKSFTSTIMREGLLHKGAEVITIVLGALVDYSQNYIDLGVKVPLLICVCTYIVLMEIGSIIENICKINPKILPDKIKKYFSKLKELNENEKN